jgi:hypothetical protein
MVNQETKKTKHSTNQWSIRKVHQTREHELSSSEFAPIDIAEHVKQLSYNSWREFLSERHLLQTRAEEREKDSTGACTI